MTAANVAIVGVQLARATRVCSNLAWARTERQVRAHECYDVLVMSLMAGEGVGCVRVCDASGMREREKKEIRQGCSLDEVLINTSFHFPNSFCGVAPTPSYPT